MIKGNKYGFQIVLNPTLPFEELLREVGDKFKESTHFFDFNKANRSKFSQDGNSRLENRIFGRYDS
ncbi:MAG: hypothetical protein ACLTS6_06200 [Anaerobutyricum sp.]